MEAVPVVECPAWCFGERVWPPAGCVGVGPGWELIDVWVQDGLE
jgi:hypothetical protein